LRALLKCGQKSQKGGYFLCSPGYPLNSLVLQESCRLNDTRDNTPRTYE